MHIACSAVAHAHAEKTPVVFAYEQPLAPFYDYMCGLLKRNPEMCFESQETKLRHDSSD